MMQTCLTNEQLPDIKKLAGLFYTAKQIAVMLGLPNDFLIEVKVENSNAYNTFWQGFYESEMLLRKKIVDTALLGSSPAQTMSMDFVNKFKKENLSR